MKNSNRTITVFTLAALLSGGAATAFAQATNTLPAISTEQAVETPATEPGVWSKIKAKFGGRENGPRGNGEMMQKLMMDADADKNGSVTQNEVDAFRAIKLAATDTSKDGALSLEEFSAAYNQMMQNRNVDAFQRFDEDGNGSVTAAELDARFGSIVERMDRNGDGALSRADRKQRGGEGKGDERRKENRPNN